MPSDLQVSNIKDLTGSNTGLSIASDGQVTIAQNNPTIQLGSNATGFTGIKNIDNWHLNGDISGSVDPIPVDKFTRSSTSSGGANMGTGMDLHNVSNNGIFTFPVTGIWKIDAKFVHYRNGDSRYIESRIKVSTTGILGSFSTLGEAKGFIQRTSSDNTFTTTACYVILDVNTAGNTGSSTAVRFSISTAGNITTQSSTSKSNSHFTFTRLADT